MDLDFTDEQEMLRDLVRSLAASACPLDTVRDLEDDAVGYAEPFWKQLGELDLVGLLIPAEYGGSGMTALEGAIVYEELGRALVPSPHLVSAVLTAGVLVRGGTDAQRTTWLPRIASGEAVVTVAALDPDASYAAKGVRTTARRDGDGWVLDGAKVHVPFASAAERLLVLARTGDAPEAVDLFLVDPAAEGVTLTQQYTIASDTQHRVELAGVRVADADRVGDGAVGSGWATWQESLLEAMVLVAAQAIGGARQALDITVQYAKDREQFDKPLGAFQAISHYLADASTNVDGGRLLAYEAAWTLAQGRSVARLAPMAKLFCCQVFRDTTAMGEQVHGGVGFTLEYDIQLYFRRAKALQLTWGDERYLSELIAEQALAG